MPQPSTHTGAKNMETQDIMETGGRNTRPFIIEGEMTRPTRTIRIIDGHYHDKFRVADGGYIKVNGKMYQLNYLDETHFSVNGGRCWHICEFGERVIDQGADVQAVTTGEEQ
jgi:hypothetical protein